MPASPPLFRRFAWRSTRLQWIVLALLVMAVTLPAILRFNAGRQIGPVLDLTAQEVRDLVPKNTSAVVTRQRLGPPHEYWHLDDDNAVMRDEFDAAFWQYNCRSTDGRGPDRLTVVFKNGVVSYVMVAVKRTRHR